MRRIAATATALALAFAAGCGGDDEQAEPIPAEQAQNMLNVLALIEDNVESGACQGAEAKVRNDLRPILDRLPEDVDADVQSALEDGVERLLDLIEEQCGEEEPDTDTDTTETETDTTETQPPETTETEPPPTETQPPQTETQPPPAETPPEDEPALPAPDQDGGTTVPEGGGAPSPNADSGTRG